MNTTLRIGDLLYRNKGFVNHIGVYWGNGRVLHNSPTNGVEIVSYAEYANGWPVGVIYTEFVDIQLLANRLRFILNSNNNYQPLINNCEHIANFLIYGRKWSPQVQATVIGCIIGAFVGGRIRDNGWLIGVIVGGLVGCISSNALRQYDIAISPPKSCGS